MNSTQYAVRVALSRVRRRTPPRDSTCRGPPVNGVLRRALSTSARSKECADEEHADEQHVELSRRVRGTAGTISDHRGRPRSFHS